MGDTCTDLGGIKDAYDSGKRRIKAGIHLSGSVSATIHQAFKPSDFDHKTLILQYSVESLAVFWPPDGQTGRF